VAGESHSEHFVALAGCPNSGKSALFNALTGSRQKVANYPGVTVEKKEGILLGQSASRVRVVDLPGAYSLDPKTPDEKITVSVLTGQGLDSADLGTPDLVVCVADATNLEKSLGFALDVKDLGLQVVLAVNMMDLALGRGIKIDLKQLAKELGIQVFPVVATKGRGVGELAQHMAAMSRHSRSEAKVGINPPRWSPADLRLRAFKIDQLLKKVRVQANARDVWTHKLDMVFLHPVWGGVILTALLFVVFQAVFSWASPAQDLLETGVGWLSTWAGQQISNETFKSFVTDGVIAGVGSFVVFIPQIVILFAFIFVLEGTGYMARAAFILDRLMSRFGLQGRSFVPLLSSFACAIPGVMATRTIPDAKDRLVTILVAPLMACSARLPVYLLLISAFVPNKTVLGVFGLQGLVMSALYLVAVLSAILVALVVKRTLIKGGTSHFLLELPSYKWPDAKNIFMLLRQRVGDFVKKAGTIIFALSVLLWFLASYPKPPSDAPQGPDAKSAIEYSFAGIVGHAIEPIFKPIGFDWRISTALIPGFAAREVMVSSLGTVFAIESQNDDELSKNLGERINKEWPLATGLALIVWYIFAPQCFSTFAVVRRETNSWKWTGFLFGYTLALAYLGAFAVFQLVSWIQA
jgi:ferrous iron transport protein B